MKIVYVRNVLFVAMAMMVMGVVSAQADDDEAVYGREMMTEQERMEHRQKMRSMDGDEREAYRKEHHKTMQERAREQGKSMPDEPGERGKGLNQGQGMGKGMGKGR